MNILFYFPTSQGSVSLETLMEEFQKSGHQVFLLGTEEKGPIHATVEKYGVITHCHIIPRNPSRRYYLKQFRFLLKFIRRNNIDLVYSHTQPANILASIANYFSKARIILCRHHSDYIMKGSNRNAKLFDRIINLVGKEFIVPSKKVYDQLTKVEGVSAKKVRLIRYAYRFERYPQPDPSEVNRIRESYDAEVLICKVSRFIPCKRYDKLIKCVNEVISSGIDVRLLILGEGPLKREMVELSKTLPYPDRIHFLGFKPNVIDYIEASDILVHFSDSEASNNVVKEAGIRKKPVAVCHDVGDFDEYIISYKNGIMMNKKQPCPDFLSFLKEFNSDRSRFLKMGENLSKDVIYNFHVDQIIQEYNEVF